MTRCMWIFSLTLAVLAIISTSLWLLDEPFEVSFSSVPGRLLGGGVKLFGGLDSIQPSILIFSLLIVVVGVLSLEHLFSVTHKYTAGTPYDELVIALEKELMIVGCTAFLFTIYLNQDSELSYKWVFAIEYADLLIPIFAFSNCLKGYMLILLSYYLSFFWGRSHHLSNEELIMDFIKNTTKGWRKLLLDALNPGVAQIEFAIVHEIFCDMYRFHADAFAFDLYVRRVLEKFVLEMIEIHVVHWVLLIGMMCFYFVESQSSSSGVYRCRDTDKETLCQQINGIYYFTFFGCIMYAVTIVTLCVTRYYELQLLRRRGVERTADYPHYLLSFVGLEYESSKQSRKRNLGHRMDRSQLTSYLASLHGTNVVYLPPGGALVPVTDTDVHSFDDQSVDEDRDATEHVGVAPVDGVHAVEARVDANKEGNGPTQFPGTSDSTFIMDDTAADVKTALALDHMSSMNVQSESPMPSEPLVSLAQVRVEEASSPDREASRRFLDRQSALSADEQQQQMQQPIDDIFLFGRPQLLFGFVKVVMMILSLYVSLWITNYAFLVVPQWLKFIAFLPYLGGMFNFALTVKSSVLLKALVEVERDLVMEILEEEEAAKALADVLREQILSQLKTGSVGSKTEQLRAIFREYDRDGSKFISKVEYKAMLFRMNIAYSAKKWTLIFAEIDRNYDGFISEDEFVLFVFPDNEIAKRAEKRRLTEVQDRIGQFRSSIVTASDQSSLTTIAKIYVKFRPVSLHSQISPSLEPLPEDEEVTGFDRVDGPETQ